MRYNFFVLFFLAYVCVVEADFNLPQDETWIFLDQHYKKNLCNFNLTSLPDSSNEILGAGSIVDTYASWAMSLVDPKAANIDQSRINAVKFADDFLKTVYSNRIFSKFIAKKNTRAKNKINFDANLIGFKITYWDENVDRRLPPHVAHVKFANSKFYYYYADPKTQYLGEPIVETMEEAFAKVGIRVPQPNDYFPIGE